MSMFYGCYVKTIDKYPNTLFYVFNPQLVRQKKLCRILGEEIKNVDERHSVCIFEQDLKSMIFYISYDKIWQVLEEKYGYNYQEVRESTSGLLNEDLKIVQFTTNNIFNLNLTWLSEDLKIGQYSTSLTTLLSSLLLNEDLKIGQYSTYRLCLSCFK